MAIFNSYVSLPEGNIYSYEQLPIWFADLHITHIDVP